jgi:hypothetical protein
MTMTRSLARSKLDPQATARHPAEGATAGAKPAPRVDRAKLTALVLWLTEVLRDLHARQLHLEALLSRAPGVRQLLRRMPRNLKVLAPEVVPFDARLWARGDPAEDSRLAKAVAWFRDHPRSTVRQTARVCGVREKALRGTPAMRELRLLRPATKGWPAQTGGTQRAVRYLKRHRPASILEVARAVGVRHCTLTQSIRFRKAWTAYARTATLDPGSRRLFGRPAAPRKDRRPAAAGVAQAPRDRLEF